MLSLSTKRQNGILITCLLTFIASSYASAQTVYNIQKRNNNNCADFARAYGEFRCYGGSENCDIDENATKEAT